MPAELTAPADYGFSIVPNDSAELLDVTRAIYVGSGGTLVAVLATGAQVTLTGLQGGTIIPIRVRRVNATGTTATGLVGLS